MDTAANITIDVHLDDASALHDMGREIREGLTASPKRISSKYFYDARGSRLFEEITRQPEYYLTDSEQAILDAHADEIARTARYEELVELGSGAAEKTRRLIEAGLTGGTLRRFVPFDVSQGIAERSSRDLSRRYPSLRIHAVVGDFEQHLDEVPHGGRRLVALLGSTIGNFEAADAAAFLRKVTLLLETGDRLLLGTDLVKKSSTLEAAYNDRKGVTAEFNRNILNVVNRNLQGDFRTEDFEHVAYYNERAARIETYLRSTRAQSVRLGEIDLDVRFDAGELLQTEVSCKYTRSSCRKLLAGAGLQLEHWYTDERETFGLSLSRLDRN